MQNSYDLKPKVSCNEFVTISLDDGAQNQVENKNSQSVSRQIKPRQSSIICDILCFKKERDRSNSSERVDFKSTRKSEIIINIKDAGRLTKQ